MPISSIALWAFISLLGPLYALLAGGISQTPRAVVFSLWIFVLGTVVYRKSKSLWARLFLFLPLGPIVAEFYSSTGTVIRALRRELADFTLISYDKFLLGGLFPDGQITLWLDTHPWIGPTTWAGKLLIEYLQVTYFSYYFWGYAFAAYLFFKMWKHRRTRTHSDLYWNALQCFLCAWIGTYLINYLFYILVPAIGPQFIYKHAYFNHLRGFGPAGFIQDLILKNQTNPTDCFPSGHTSLSWITALMSLRITPRYGKFNLVMAVSITLATLILRYHYVIDLICAVPLILLGLTWGGYWSRYKKLAKGLLKGKR